MSPEKANNFATFSPRLLGIRGAYNAVGHKPRLLPIGVIL